MYKKLLTALMSIMICTFFSTSIVSAGEATYDGAGGGGFRISDTGIGPGIGYDSTGGDADPLYLSARSAARYTGDSGAGGFAAANAGEQWAVVTGSTKAKSELALEFLMRGSQNQEDNNLYQHLTTGITNDTSLSAPTTDPTGTDWMVRGAGGTGGS